MKLNNFALREGKIVYMLDVPEEPYCLDDAIDWKRYEKAAQSAIANGIEVVNQDEICAKLCKHYRMEENTPEWEIFRLQCSVEIDVLYLGNHVTESGEGDADTKTVARVTFEQPEKAGQEQETAEEFLKKMKPQVATFDKHDKVAKLFDYYDITGFAVQYASQQTASLQKQVDLLKVRAEKLAEREQMTGAENAGLLARIEQLQADNEGLRATIEGRPFRTLAQSRKRISALESEVERLRSALHGMVQYWEWSIGDPHFNEYINAKKALNPQDNQK